jgi:ATP-binding cassette subfamily B protein
MELLRRYLRPHRRTIVVNQVFSLLDPQIFRLIIDRYGTRAGTMPPAEFLQGVGLLLFAFVGVAMVSRIAKNFQDYFVNVVSQAASSRLYADGIAHALSLPYRAFEEQQSGALLQQLEKARGDSRDVVGQTINSVFLSSLTFLLVLGYAFVVHWALGVSLLVMAPALGFLVSVLGKRIKAVQGRIFRETSSLAGSTTESLRNVELIKSLGLLLLVMLILVSRQAITLGEFLSLLFYSFFVFSPLAELGAIITKYQETRASLDNAARILAMEAAPTNSSGLTIPSVQSVEFSEVSYRHPAAREMALDGVSFSARAGESVAFVGPSGAGKSTLIKLLLGLYQPNSGRILVNDTDLAGVDYDSLRHRVGFVPQSIELFAGSIRDNLRFVRPEATDAECLESLEAAQLKGLLERSREGLDTRVGEGGLKLSGGERQRLAIARALLRRPDLLIFDEATSSLDSETEKEITHTIEGIIRTRPSFITLLIAHRLSTVMRADRIVVLSRGKVAELGGHLELMRAKGLYYTLWRQQGYEREEIAAAARG